MKIIAEEIWIDPSHRIDLLAETSNGEYIIIELKACSATPRDVEQLANYKENIKNIIYDSKINGGDDTIILKIQEKPGQKYFHSKTEIKLQRMELRNACYYLIANEIPSYTREKAEKQGIEINCVSVGTKWTE